MDDEKEKMECGHSEKEHAENEARGNRAREKFNKFITDVAPDLMDNETFSALRRVVEKEVKKSGAPVSLDALRGFAAGFDFGVLSYRQSEENIAPIMGGVHRIVRDLEEERDKRVKDIDITKSRVDKKK